MALSFNVTLFPTFATFRSSVGLEDGNERPENPPNIENLWFRCLPMLKSTQKKFQPKKNIYIFFSKKIFDFFLKNLDLRFDPRVWPGPIFKNVVRFKFRKKYYFRPNFLNLKKKKNLKKKIRFFLNRKSSFFLKNHRKSSLGRIW